MFGGIHAPDGVFIPIFAAAGILDTETGPEAGTGDGMFAFGGADEDGDAGGGAEVAGNHACEGVATGSFPAAGIRTDSSARSETGIFAEE